MVEVIRLVGMPRGDNVIRLGQKKPFRQRLTAGLITAAAAQTALLAGLVSRRPSIAGKVFTATKGFLLTGAALGALEVSRKLRTFIKEKAIDPGAGGRFIGRQIETGLVRDDKKTFKERLAEGAKKAGLIGAGVVAAVTGISLGRSALRKLREAKIPKIPKAIKIPGVSGIIPGAPTSLLVKQPTQPLPPQIEPFTAAKKVEEKEKPMVVTPSMPTINTKITVSPKINISFRKTRRFINQQVLIQGR